MFRDLGMEVEDGDVGDAHGHRDDDWYDGCGDCYERFDECGCDGVITVNKHIHTQHHTNAQTCKHTEVNPHASQ